MYYLNQHQFVNPTLVEKEGHTGNKRQQRSNGTGIDIDVYQINTRKNTGTVRFEAWIVMQKQTNSKKLDESGVVPLKQEGTNRPEERVEGNQ